VNAQTLEIASRSLSWTERRDSSLRSEWQRVKGSQWQKHFLQTVIARSKATKQSP